MTDVIQLLPDAVANQIAAGEVVQRPSSVVKELLENSIDAGATQIQTIIKDGGKALIQVIDNGIGMSGTDARLSFERHATSKIREASDLYGVKTMGFRGEALASIAAVAEVELKTRRESDLIGTYIRINTSEFEEQKHLNCPIGSNFSIQNLFFNIPARRKFLKSSSLELKHIISEFQRVALANPLVTMSLNHNGVDIYNLQSGSLKQRIVSLFGRAMNQQLLDCDTNTSIAKITGFIGRPESARKSAGEQFLFVNHRYFKSPYLHKAVLNAFERLLPPESIPPYFIFFEVDPTSIDVNIHPTKTEIKFEDERSIWQILHAAVRETLGKFAIVPAIDFESEMVVDIPFFPRNAPVSIPDIQVNPDFNPFTDDKPLFRRSAQHQNQSVKGWEQLYQDNKGDDFDTGSKITQTIRSKGFEENDETFILRFFQLKEKYILTSVKSGLMLIDQKRAHERILYEQYLLSLNSDQRIAQRELYPQSIDLAPGDYALLIDMIKELSQLGIEISNLGHNQVAINSLPVNLKVTDPIRLIEDLLFCLKENQHLPEENASHRIALSMAKAAAIGYGRSLTSVEMQDLVDKLFACQSPNISPDGRAVVNIISIEELEKKFK